jgi:chromosome segregation ATPase
MAKLMKTMFGKNGVLSNVVDLATLPNEIKLKKNDVHHYETQLLEIMNKNRFIEQKLELITESEKQIEEDNEKLKLIQNELFELLSSQVKDAKLLVAKSIEFQTITERHESLCETLKIQIKEYQDATENFENEQKVVRDKLDEVSQELSKLEEKLARKKTQMDGNLCKITKK